MKKFLPVVLVVIILAALAVTFLSGGMSMGRPTVRYPYVCLDCKAVCDVSELKKDYPKNWRIPPKGPSDSVVICLRCNKGWAYPVATCEECKTQHVLHATGDSRCPKCFPQAAAAAKKAGVDVLFHPQ